MLQGRPSQDGVSILETDHEEEVEGGADPATGASALPSAHPRGESKTGRAAGLPSTSAQDE